MSYNNRQSRGESAFWSAVSTRGPWAQKWWWKLGQVLFPFYCMLCASIMIFFKVNAPAADARKLESAFISTTVNAGSKVASKWRDQRARELYSLRNVNTPFGPETQWPWPAAAPEQCILHMMRRKSRSKVAVFETYTRRPCRLPDWLLQQLLLRRSMTLRRTNREREILTGSLMRSFATSVVFFSFLGIEILAKFVEFTLEKKNPPISLSKNGEISPGNNNTGTTQRAPHNHEGRQAGIFYKPP